MRLLSLLSVAAIPYLATADFIAEDVNLLDDLDNTSFSVAAVKPAGFLDKVIDKIPDDIKRGANDVIFDPLNDKIERSTEFCRNTRNGLPGDFSGQSAWMRDLQDNRKVTSLYLPGTHDSGAVQGGFFSQTQALSIYEQLRSGIRFLDVRVGLSSRNLHIYHGITYQGKSFVDVCNDIWRFLKENPREFVIMRLRREQDKDNENEIKNAFLADYNQFKDMFYYGKNNIGALEVRDIRGKVVVLEERFDSGINNNLDYFPSIDQQDKWDAKDTNEKKNAIKGFINSGRNQNKLSLNYFSMAANAKNLNPSVSACEINSLAKGGSATPQVMIFDMPSLQIIKEVYKRNF